MNDLTAVDALETRLMEALADLTRSAARALDTPAADPGAAPVEGPGGDTVAAVTAELADNKSRIQELEAENADLSARLDAMTAAREADLAQLDTLIDQLKPLIEEAV